MSHYLYQMYLRNLLLQLHAPAAVPAGKVNCIAPLVVFTKYPTPLTAVNPDVLTVVSQEAAPVAPKPAAVPLFVIVTPAGIVKYLHYPLM
jgi:hypothetical protein